MKKNIFAVFKRKNRQPIAETPLHPYYEGVSQKLGIAQVILYLTLLAFVVLFILANTELLTYRNFYYFFKDLNASVENSELLSAESVSYSTDKTQSFTLYRQGLAVAGNNSVTVFTATGRQSISQNISYQNPIAVGSGKYLLVYEHGGTQYSLYNSYAQILSSKTDYPIQGAAVSDNGTYALITSSEEYTSVVLLYNSNFSLINRYNKNGYVMDVSINKKGNLIAILSSETVNGMFESELSLYKPGERTLTASASIGTSLALACEFTETGDISVLCSDGISTYTSACKRIAFYDFDGREIVCADYGKDGIAVCLKSAVISQKKHIVVFDKHGKIMYNKDVDENVEAISRFDNVLFLMASNGITRLQLQNNEKTFHACHTEQRTILAIRKDEVLVCSPQKAVYLHID